MCSATFSSSFSRVCCTSGATVATYSRLLWTGVSTFSQTTPTSAWPNDESLSCTVGIAAFCFFGSWTPTLVSGTIIRPCFTRCCVTGCSISPVW